MKHANHLDALAPRITQLHAALLRDWDDPTVNEAELCARHELTPDQLRAFAARPGFARDVETLRAVRELRRPLVESRTRDLALSCLCALARRDPSSASQAKESRMAIKQLLEVLEQTRATHPPPQPPEPSPSRNTAAAVAPARPPTPPPTHPRRTPCVKRAGPLLECAGGIPTS